MAIKRILVAYGGNPAESGGLRIAIDLARKHGAGLTGVVTLGPTHIEEGYRRFITRGIAEIIDERDSMVANDARARFEEHLAAAGFGDRAEFLAVDSERDADLCDLASGYDLLVYCDHPVEDGRAHLAQTPGDIVVGIGCPMLLVPAYCPAASVSGPTLIAWDGGRAAARALGDALHLGLLDQKATTLLSVGTDLPASSPLTQAILDRLTGHGVDVRPQQVPAGRSGVAQTIVDQAKASGAGMIVMGAFQHSRLREEWLGGVTVSMLEQRLCPVLMSH